MPRTTLSLAPCTLLGVVLAHVFYDLCCMRAYALTRTFAPGPA